MTVSKENIGTMYKMKNLRTFKVLYKNHRTYKECLMMRIKDITKGAS